MKPIQIVKSERIVLKDNPHPLELLKGGMIDQLAYDLEQSGLIDIGETEISDGKRLSIELYVMPKELYQELFTIFQVLLISGSESEKFQASQLGKLIFGNQNK